MFAPKGAHRVGSTPDPYPDIQMDSQTTAPDPELLERDSELLALDHALAEAVDGRGSVVAVEGPPGIGKSSLVTACIERAREREMYTLSVRATELERSYPYGIVRQTADSVALDKTPRSARRCSPAPPGSRFRSWIPASARGRRQPRADVPAPARPVLAHGEPRPRAPAPDHDRRRPVGRRGRRWPPSASSACGSPTCRWCCSWRVRTAEVGQLAVPLAEILADPATVSIRPGPAVARRAPDSAIEALLGIRGPGVRGGLPPRHRRQPVPARAARERGARGGHRAGRGERGRGGLARPRHGARVGAAAPRAPAEWPARRWRAHWRCSESTTWRSATWRRSPKCPRTPRPTRSPSSSAPAS